MPELPEVETVRRGLAATLEGDIIREVMVRRRDLRIPFPANLREVLTGARLERVERRAKYLLGYLDNGWVMLAHLGMSGRMVVVPEMPQVFGKHDHLVLAFSSGKVLLFNDARRFGLVTLAQAATVETHPLLAHLGPEPLSEGFNEAYLSPALCRRSGAIKQVIMDQSLVVGVGNIYACEALFGAGIAPDLPANQCSKEQVGRLVVEIKQVLNAAIASGGSTLRDYVRSSGDAGYFQHAFRVYGRENQPCVICTTPIRRMVQGGRSTFFCPKCQKHRENKADGQRRERRA